MSSINSAANHQPVLLGVAQHGSLDDAVYFVRLEPSAPFLESLAKASPRTDGL